MNSRYSIYVATSPCGKQYVGQTTDFPQRVGKHYSRAKAGGKYPIQNAIRKYGILKFEVVFVAFGKEVADQTEKLFIKELNTKAPNGYNLTDGGEGCVGYKHSQETIEKFRIKLLGKPSPRKGKKQYPHVIEASRVAGRLRVGPKNNFFGKKHSEETRRKMSTNNSRKKPIFCIETNQEFESIDAAARALNIRGESVPRQIKGKQKTVCGYTFKEVA